MFHSAQAFNWAALEEALTTLDSTEPERAFTGSCPKCSAQVYAGDKRCRSCKKTLPPGLEAELALAVDAFIIDAIRGKLPDWEITSRLKARGVEPRDGGLEYWRDEVKENVEALCFELVWAQFQTTIGRQSAGSKGHPPVLVVASRVVPTLVGEGAEAAEANAIVERVYAKVVEQVDREASRSVSLTLVGGLLAAVVGGLLARVAGDLLPDISGLYPGFVMLEAAFLFSPWGGLIGATVVWFARGRTGTFVVSVAVCSPLLGIAICKFLGSGDGSGHWPSWDHFEGFLTHLPSRIGLRDIVWAVTSSVVAAVMVEQIRPRAWRRLSAYPD